MYVVNCWRNIGPVSHALHHILQRVPLFLLLILLMMKPALIRDTCGLDVARSSSPFTGQLLAGGSSNQCAEISAWQFRRTAAQTHSAKPEGLTVYLMVHLKGTKASGRRKLLCCRFLSRRQQAEMCLYSKPSNLLHRALPALKHWKLGSWLTDIRNPRFIAVLLSPPPPLTGLCLKTRTSVLHSHSPFLLAGLLFFPRLLKH
jgi:hypothetical protein